jgi:transcriptional regulator with XRE-family HTH domain
VALRYKKQLGAAIRRRRDEFGWSQAELAERVEAWLRRHGYRNSDNGHFDALNISRWERGVVAPNQENFEAVAAALKTTPAKLAAGITPDPKPGKPEPTFETTPPSLEARLEAMQRELEELSALVRQALPPTGGRRGPR